MEAELGSVGLALSCGLWYQGLTLSEGCVAVPKPLRHGCVGGA